MIRMLLALTALVSPAMAMAKAGPADVAQAKEVLMKGIGFPTVEGRGQTVAYAHYIASVLKAAGYADSEVVVTPMEGTATLEATLKGTTPGAKPIVLLAHMDVVEAKPADWTRDPFVAVEEGGYIFGRGAEDNKYDLSMMVVAMARLKAAGFRPKRDIVLVLTGDEETRMVTTQALAQKYRNAEIVLNGDGGGGTLGEDGTTALYYGLQAGEKTYADYAIELTDVGGHSSTPTDGNPIYRMARILARIDAYDFPDQANELTRASLKARSGRIGGAVGDAMRRYAENPNDKAAAAVIAARPEFVGQIRTTCVATEIDGGHARNALPQRATANINCRIFPGVPVEAVRATLAELAGKDASVKTIDEPVASDASPLRGDVVGAVTTAVRARYPGLDIIPSMSGGATDSFYFRVLGVPSYGVASLFMRDADGFAHGLNERAPVAGIGGALDQWDSVLRTLGGK
ncbi:M20/M25/M40 family metallo-hydrolase [Sphingomonas sanxanigenens]|uniref:Peptidase M20 dimerisation domain-containing protein n=1 Tax=Sphingomonas sanxanigenens DSM 19645 = NX02 TaxID=1123269 RepID=W0AGH3_9SPHN|nr:hypothetical protein NX02_22995 [Sphingomonas sanxanigenens DSM 19645 = NX02]